MSEISSHTLKNNEIVGVLGNMLKLVFFDNSRVNAKRTFRDALEGQVLRLPALAMPDKSEISLKLKIDASNFNGDLSFSYFRNHLGALLSRISEQMKEGASVPILSAGDGVQRIVNIPVGHAKGDEVNVLAMGFDVRHAEIMIKLLYVDPEQFKPKGEEPAA